MKLNKEMPNVLELEEAVLGAIMLEKNAILKAVNILKPEYLYHDKHVKIFNAILDLFKNSNPIDILTVTNKLRERNDLESAGGAVYKNEDPEAGTLRELFEETKIKIDRADYLLGTYCSKAEGKRDKVFIYIKETDSDFIPKLSLEIKDAKWFPLDNLPETATPATRFRIGEYLRGLKNVDGVWQEEFSE